LLDYDYRLLQSFMNKHYTKYMTALIYPKLYNNIYIIIWLSPYVLSVRSLSPPKPAGLAPQIFAGMLQIGCGTVIAKKN
jgi:hypothetical protein